MPERRALTRARLRGAALATLLAALAVGPARAQSRDEPLLVFSVYGGLSESSPLWRIPVQPLAAPNGLQDTVDLVRRLRPGLVAGLVTTYFASPHFGWSVDVSYMGIGSEQVCVPPQTWKPDSQNENSQVCTTANGAHVSTSVVGFLAGGTWRPFPTGPVQPFLRATAGPGLFGTSSFYETNGFAVLATPTCQSGCTVTILHDPDHASLTWVVDVTAGASLRFAPGYQFRVEARDIITRLPVATGPRDPTNASTPPPTGSVVKHLPTFLFGVDILLERRHPRRY